MYIRIGEIPTDEKSKIHNNCRETVGYENGVSVWDTVLLEDGYHLIAPLNGNPCTYGDFIGDAFPDEYFPAECFPHELKIYVVTGDEVGRGSDNEPLLRNVKIIETLPSDYFRYAESKEKGRYK